MPTTLANELLLEQALEDSRYKTFPLRAKTDIVVVLERGLNQILKQEQKELLRITLLSHGELGQYTYEHGYGGR